MSNFQLHLLILYVPFVSPVFAVAPLAATEWLAVVCISAPVIFVDELLKLFSRRVVGLSSGKYSVSLS